MDTINGFLRQNFDEVSVGVLIVYAAFSLITVLWRMRLRLAGELTTDVRFLAANFGERLAALGYVLTFWRIGAKSVGYAIAVTIWRLSFYVLIYVALFSRISAAQGHPVN